jgi:8-oxo-dGTP diphosphatase
MIKYVVGFIFSFDGKDVLLIRKLHPEWQAGRLNGIGGSIKDNETSTDAMIRECKEETGLDLKTGWQEFLLCSDIEKNIQLYCFRNYIFENHLKEAKTMTDEHITIVNAETASNLTAKSIIGNLRVLLRMAMDKNFVSGQMFVKLDQS